MGCGADGCSARAGARRVRAADRAARAVVPLGRGEVMSEGMAPPPKKACPAGTSGGQPPWLLVRSDHQPLGEVEGAFASPYPITAGATRPHGLSVDFGRGSAAGRPTAGGFGGWADQTEQSGELVGGFTPSANGGGFGSTAGNRLPVNSTPRSALRVRDGNIERGGALSRGASASGGGSVCTPAPGCRGAPRPGVENTPLRPMALAEGAFTAVGNAQISSGTPGAWQASSALKCRLDLRPSAELAGMVRALRAEKQQLQTQLTAAHNAVLEGNHRNGADVQRESRAQAENKQLQGELAAAREDAKKSADEVKRLRLVLAQHEQLKKDCAAAHRAAQSSAAEVQRLQGQAFDEPRRQRLDVFDAAERKLASLNLDIYKPDVMLRLADALGRGKLDASMDVYMLCSLAHNAHLAPSNSGRRFGNQLLRFWTYVFQQYSAKGAHRALTAGHCEAAEGGAVPINMLNCPSPDCIKKHARSLDGPDDVCKGGVYATNINRGARRFLLRQLEIEKRVTRAEAVAEVERWQQAGQLNVLLKQLRLTLSWDETATVARIGYHGDKIVGHVNLPAYQGGVEAVQAEYDSILHPWVKKILSRGQRTVGDVVRSVGGDNAEDRENIGDPGEGEDDDDEFDVEALFADDERRSVVEGERVSKYLVELRQWLQDPARVQARSDSHEALRKIMADKNAGS